MHYLKEKKIKKKKKSLNIKLTKPETLDILEIKNSISEKIINLNKKEYIIMIRKAVGYILILIGIIIFLIIFANMSSVSTENFCFTIIIPIAIMFVGWLFLLGKGDGQQGGGGRELDSDGDGIPNWRDNKPFDPFN